MSPSKSESPPADSGSPSPNFHLPVLSPRRKSIQAAMALLALLGLIVAGIFVDQQSFGRAREALESRQAALEAESPDPALGTAIEALEAGRQTALVLGLLALAVLFFTLCGMVRDGARTVQVEIWIRRLGAGDLDYRVEMTGKDEIALAARDLETLRQSSIRAMQLDLVKRLSADLKQKNERLEQVLAELRRTQDQIILRQKLVEMGELTAGVAHEIRNPLNFVHNFAETSQELLDELRETLDGEKPDPRERDQIASISGDLAANLERIRFHTHRANRIVEQMLAFGGAQGSFQLVDINAMLHERALLAYRSACSSDPDFQLEIRDEYDPEAGQVNVVPADMGRALLNIVGNACYATNEKRQQLAGSGGYVPTLWLRTRRNGDEVEIRIRDNGIGIPPDVIGKIFNPFFSTKPADRGTGLGLSLSNDIVRQHGGSLTAASDPGEYTEMVLTIPEKCELFQVAEARAS